MTDAARNRPLLRIREVAHQTGLTPRAIRYYEELGLLAPAARSERSYRLYDADDLERLRFIRGLRDDAGFSLAEIGRLLEEERARERNREQFRAASDPAERLRIVTEALATVDRRVATLRARIVRLDVMVAEAEHRREHLSGHLHELEGEREAARTSVAPTQVPPRHQPAR